ARVTISPDKVEIEDLSVVGAGGDLTGSVLITPRLVTLEARGQNVDLDVLAGLAGLPRGKLGGKLTIDADATVADDVQSGRVRLELDRGSIEGISGLKLALEASLDGDSVDGSARAEIAGLAKASTQFDVTLAGKAADPESWRRATGRVEFRLDELELSNLVYLLPKSARIEDVEGKLTGQVIATRENPDDLPSLSILAGTQGLRVEQAAEKKGDPPLVVEGIEVQLGSRIDGPSGDVDASVRLVDPQGGLASASARTNLPLGELVAQPQKIFSELSQATLLGKVVVDQRPIETLPAFIRPKAMNGTLRAEATLGGSWQSPLVTAKGSLESLVVGTSSEAVPVDVCAQLDYSHQNADFTLRGETFLHENGRLCSGRRVGHLRSIGQLNIGEAAIPGGPPRLFQGEALLLLEGLPLEMIAPLGANGVRGQAHGRIVLEQDSDGRPNLNSRIELKDVRVESAAIGNGQLNVRSDGEMLRVVTTFDQDEKSRLQGELTASLAWNGLAPDLDRGQPLLLEGRAQHVDAVMLLPALRDVFSELSGPIDGRVRLELTPDLAAREDRWQGDLEGDLAMTNGSMQFAGLGMRLSDVRFGAKTKQVGGQTVIEVQNFSATSRARKPNVFAQGWVSFEKLNLVHARANVRLDDVPILIQGVSQANANTGNRWAVVDLVPEEDRMLVTIDVPKLTAELPPSSGRDVISIDPNRSISVLQPLSEPRKKKSDEPAKPWELVFVLRDDVKVSRSDLNVPISGEVTLSLADEVDVSGGVKLRPGGRVQFAGKTFVVEDGEVIFDTDDPGDPHLRVRASWRAPEGTTIYLKVRGTFSKAEPTWESDPQLSQDQIYALLLGGSTGDQSSGSGTASATAVGLGGDLLGKVLSDSPLLRRVAVRGGSEQSLDDRTYQTYTAAYQVTDEISVETSYKTSDASGATERNEEVSVTFDWRFRKNWSLRTEGGTIGAGLDLLWTHHY
ncbi:MAG TPA: translocation/assembly module TamB domain-containing protein, partial [Polyangiaceae bacterium]|nr:translocation/assembly module TamB domain-containing protein [Polyangiaceae bacterium]